MGNTENYKCLRCNEDMISVPCIEIKTYAKDETSRLVMSGYFHGQDRGPAESITLGHSTHMCPKCGMLEIHVCGSDVSFLERRYGNR